MLNVTLCWDILFFSNNFPFCLGYITSCISQAYENNDILCKILQLATIDDKLLDLMLVELCIVYLGLLVY